jgi:ribosomal protein L40E
MANKGIYFTEEELDYISKQDEGYVRKLVQEDMGVPADRMPVRSEIHEAAQKIKSKNDVEFASDQVCKHCGAFLPYHGAKTCKMCKKKQ